MKGPHAIASRQTAGEYPLPGGRLPLVSLRTLLFSSALAFVLAVPMAVLASLLGPRVDAPATLDPAPSLDQRTQGQRAVEAAQNKLLRAPGDPRAATLLANAYLLRARETADPSYYTKAEQLLESALAKRPDDPDALIAAGSLALSRHDFAAALGWGERAAKLAPYRVAAHGVLADALVELGRYDEAVAAAQRMVDLRPDLASYSRISYLRELHGDIDGAIELMLLAVQAGAPVSEATAWSEVQLGHLFFAKGDLDAASRSYERSLERIGGYAHGTAGLARVRAARGDLAGAAELYERALARLPHPDFVIALGDVYARMGDAGRAQQQHQLVGVMQRLLAANGVRAEVDFALFDADHGTNLARAVDVARAEYALRPSVQVADILAWSEFRYGDLENAARHSREAMRLGTQDPLLLYRAGVIAKARGETERAEALLRRSFDLNPRFSLLWSDDLAARVREFSSARGSP